LLRNFSAIVVRATLNILYPHSMNQKFDDMILLAGFPDIALSRPHSIENSERF
jgi:hypothetical protein